MTTLNFTHLAEKSSPEFDTNAETGSTLPKSSEHFWTSIFAMFLLHLGRSEEKASPIWIFKTITQTAKEGPYYRAQKEGLSVNGLKFENMAVEVSATDLAKHFQNLGIPVEISGIEPDITLLLPGDRYVFIENKVTYNADLNPNQANSYAELVIRLLDQGKQAQLFLLKSCGCGDPLYNSAKILQDKFNTNKFPDAFGVLLWEGIIRQMCTSHFALPGINIASWKRFAEELEKDADLQMVQKTVR